MAYLNGVVTAGIVEATRVAQAVVNREAETGVAVVVGQRIDRAHAEHLPEPTAGARIDQHGPREGGPGSEGYPWRHRARRDYGQDPEEAPASGSLIDVRA